MEFDDFQDLVNKVRSRKPALFGLERDPCATDDEVREAEESLGVRFPAEYWVFVKQVGGGYFGFTNVFSPTNVGHWGIVERNRSTLVDLGDFVAVSDNGVGDYYGFAVKDGVCQSEICFFDHETAEIVERGYSDLFEYLAEIGLKAR